MPKEERLSAVAKRRRLNGNVAKILTTSSNASRSQSPSKPLIRTNEPLSEVKSIVTKTDEQDSNTFAALVDQDVVHFSHFREIEALNDRAIKIRLSKGQKCVIPGRYGIWVKEGIIEFFGAKLQASSELYHVFFSSVFDIPPITALTNSVEFELHSCSDISPVGFGDRLFEWTWQYSEETLQTSFFVHGHSNPVDEQVLPTVREYDERPISEGVYRASHLKHAVNGNHHTILLCGRQSNGTPMLISSLINHLITRPSDTTKEQRQRSVVLFDLDTEAPLFAPPGCVSLVHVRKPILGSPFTHPGILDPADEDSPSEILKLQYMDRATYASLARNQLDLLVSFLDHVAKLQLQNCILIVRAHDWIEYLDPDHIAAATKKLAPDLMIYSGSDMGSNTAQLRDYIQVQSGVEALVDIVNTPSKDPPLYVQHRLLIQSHFQFRGYEHGCPQWHVVPAHCDTKRHLWVSYGDESSVTSRITIPGVEIIPSDVIDALDGCIVVITIQNGEGTHDLQDLDVPKVRNGATTRKAEPEMLVKSGDKCIGLGIIFGFDQEKKRICLLTPMVTTMLRFHESKGHRFELIAQKSDIEGRFDTSWLQLEGETTASSRKSAKLVYRHSLDVRSR